MITFELKKRNDGADPDEMEVFLDEEGLKSLLSQLRFLEDGRSDHVHLMSESWGGTHLEGKPQSVNGMVIQHVKFLLLRAE